MKLFQFRLVVTIVVVVEWWLMRLLKVVVVVSWFGVGELPNWSLSCNLQSRRWRLLLVDGCWWKWLTVDVVVVDCVVLGGWRRMAGRLSSLWTRKNIPAADIQQRHDFLDSTDECCCCCCWLLLLRCWDWDVVELEVEPWRTLTLF